MENKDAQRYIQEYAKKHNIEGKLNTKKSYLTLAWLCRLQMNGNDIDHGVNYIKKEIEDVMQEEVEEPEVKVETGPVITIQDRIREKVSECVGELEGQIDELVTTAFKANVSPYAIMHTLDIKGIHANRVIDAFKSKRQEFDEVMNTDDKEVKEGYSNFKKTELKKLVAYCDQVIMDGLKITGAATKSRKPRKRKEKTPDQLVEKMKLCVEFAELNLKSVKPREIVGAMALWVYNTKTRKLGCYHAEDAAGFSVKGTSLTNFNETKSVQKKLRKPEVTLPEVLNGGKVYLRSAMENIRAVESALTGRINEDTILVRAITK
jgi:HEPN domain-containing protein